MGVIILAISSLKGSVNELKMRVWLRSCRDMVVLLLYLNIFAMQRCKEVRSFSVFVCAVFGVGIKGCVGMEVKRREEKIESAFKKIFVSIIFVADESLMRTVHLTLFYFTQFYGTENRQ